VKIKNYLINNSIKLITIPITPTIFLRFNSSLNIHAEYIVTNAIEAAFAALIYHGFGAYLYQNITHKLKIVDVTPIAKNIGR
jgi:hypothetical protein